MMLAISESSLDTGGPAADPHINVAARPTGTLEPWALGLGPVGQGVCAFTFGYRYFAGFLREDG